MKALWAESRRTFVASTFAKRSYFCGPCRPSSTMKRAQKRSGGFGLFRLRADILYH
jgi:hypothetical protein